MKSLQLIGLATAGLMLGCQAPMSRDVSLPLSPTIAITAANPSNFTRADQALVFSADMLGLAAETPLQSDSDVGLQWIDRDADGTRESLLVMTDLAAGATRQIDVNLAKKMPAIPSRVAAEISVKEGGNWQGDHYEGGDFKAVSQLTTPPQYTDHSEYIRYEGPGIESEQVAYRVYLDWRNGLDVFGKTRPGLVLNQVGLDGYHSYHEMADWGMDIQKVGLSAGVGGFGLWRDGAVQRVSDVQQHHAIVVDDGPLWASYQIRYEGWSYQGHSLGDLTALLSMQAGSRLLKIDLQAQSDIDEFAVTLPKHKNAQFVTGSLDITGRAWTYAYTLGPQSMLGEAQANFVLFQRTSHRGFNEDEHNHVLRLRAPAGKLSYYTGTLWSGEQDARLDKASVEALLQREAERLTLAPRVQLANALREDAIRQQVVEKALLLSERVASSEVARHGQELAFGHFDTTRNRMANWEYTTGLLTQAAYQQGKLTGNADLQDWARGIIDSYVQADGSIRTYDMQKFNIDSINSGKLLLQLYRDTGEQKYRLAADLLRAQLRNHPKLDAGAFWHKKRYPYQLWLDGVYMGMPFLLEYSLMFEDGAAVAEVMHEFEVVRKQLRDPATGLYWHAWDEKRQQKWSDPDTGLSRFFWSRGMGWLAMALADSYALLPADYQLEREALAEMAEELAQTLSRYQTQGVWYQIADRPDAIGNYAESSASAMFTYFLAKGVESGLLSAEWRDLALSSYQALVNQFVTIDAQQQVHITNACEVGGLGYGRDGSYAYYMSEPVVANDPKVLGPFIMTGQTINALQR